jgi:hypothetical protein
MAADYRNRGTVNPISFALSMNAFLSSVGWRVLVITCPLLPDEKEWSQEMRRQDMVGNALPSFSAIGMLSPN